MTEDERAEDPSRYRFSNPIEGSLEHPTPMAARRPAWLTDAIDAEFANIVTAARRYKSHGENRDYDFREVAATDLIASYRRDSRQGGPLRILDVGTGAGGFITQNDWPEGDKVQGITGIDYRVEGQVNPVPPPPGDPRYIVGNAEHLDQIPGLEEEYDVVVSKLTIQHFVDQFGTLEQILNRVAPGGLICLDVASGFGRYAPSTIASMLEDQGFAPMPGFDVDRNSNDLVMLRSDHPEPVNFGLGYQQRSIPDLEEALDRPLTPREKHRLAWEYIDIAHTE